MTFDVVFVFQHIMGRVSVLLFDGVSFSIRREMSHNHNVLMVAPVSYDALRASDARKPALVISSSDVDLMVIVNKYTYNVSPYPLYVTQRHHKAQGRGR